MSIDSNKKHHKLELSKNVTTLVKNDLFNNQCKSWYRFSYESYADNDTK